MLASAVEATDTGLMVVVDGLSYFFLWEECSEALAKASDLERKALKMSPSGYGIHWPLIDEDLAVGPLVRGREPVSN